MNSPAIIRSVRVPGANLYTESRGSGPLLLFIVGGNGDPSVFVPVANALASDFTVVTYARRGFSLSPVDSDVDDSTRLSLDVSDALALIEEYGGEPADVFGSSSGAIVALDLVARYSDHVKTVVVHEAPILALLDDAQWWREKFDGLYATYLSEGLWPALAQFGEAVGLSGLGGGSEAAIASSSKEFQRRSDFDMRFWFEHELRQYPAYIPNEEALALVASQIVPAGGAEGRVADPLPYRLAAALAKLIDRDLVEFVGGHDGYMQDPSEFAATLREVLGH